MPTIGNSADDIDALGFDPGKQLASRKLGAISATAAMTSADPDTSALQPE